MSHALHTYTPRVRPLNYDALDLVDGCEDETGIEFYGMLPFERVCITSPHDDTDIKFNQPVKVSYQLGPDTTGGAYPYLTEWTAWVGAVGVRIGKLGIIDPATSEDLGQASSLYPSTKPVKISHAFGASGLLAMAVQLSFDQIEVKRYTNNLGAVATYSWAGRSALIFWSGLLIKGEGNPDQGLVVYYLKEGFPRTLFARFEQDNFGAERIVIDNMRATPVRLVSARKEGSKFFLRYIDDLGRDCTMQTGEFAIDLSDAGTATTSLDSGLYFKQGLIVDTESDDRAKCSTSLDGGLVFAAIAEPGDQPPAEKATCRVSLLEGEYLKQ